MTNRSMMKRELLLSTGSKRKANFGRLSALAFLPLPSQLTACLQGQIMKVLTNWRDIGDKPSRAMERMRWHGGDSNHTLFPLKSRIGPPLQRMSLKPCAGGSHVLRLDRTVSRTHVMRQEEVTAPSCCFLSFIASKWVDLSHKISLKLCLCSSPKALKKEIGSM